MGEIPTLDRSRYSRNAYFSYVTTEIWEIFFMKNTVIKDNNVVALGSSKRAFMSNVPAATKNAEIELVENYLKQLDWKVNENSNMTYSIQGLNNYIASEISKNYWLNKVYPADIRNAHISGDIHIHDLNIISVYCVGWDLKDLLTEGFRGVKGKIESAPPKHLTIILQKKTPIQKMNLP